jgi:small-conductance mechanosensitive channel
MNVYYRIFAIVWAVLLLVLWCMPLPAEAQEAEEGNQDNQSEEDDDSVYHGTYYEQEWLNAGLPERDIVDDLDTPQAALEHFVLSARSDDFETAAYALNLNLIPVQNQAEQAPDLAYKLYYLLQQNALIDWDSMPDRPDGQIDTFTSQDKNPLAGAPRRNIRLGSIALDGRDIPIRVQRVMVEGQRPVWVFSASTVENIPALYEEYKPGFLAQQVPAWAKVEVAGDLQLWEWAAIMVFLLVSGGVGWLIRWLFDRAFSHSSNLWWRGLTDTIATPAAVFGGLILLYVLTRNLLSLTGSFTRFFDYGIVVLLIIAGTWLVMSGIKFISDYVVDRHVLNQAERDIGHARQLSTYLFVGRRVVLFLAMIGGTMLLLRFFGVFERVSISLLASAGLFTVILGVAAQRVLGDIIAGLQIALTQPIRVGDTVEFDDAWGTVERITYTYLTIHTWDEQRVVVPLQYFMSRPSTNLTKTTANLIKPIYLYVDYHTNVEHIREAFTQLLEHDDDWDRNISPTVHVTNITDEAMEVRLLCSASDPETAWYLRFRISERIMAYLRDMKTGPYLPKQRLVIEQAEHFNGQPQRDNGHVQHEHAAAE